MRNSAGMHQYTGLPTYNGFQLLTGIRHICLEKTPSAWGKWKPARYAPNMAKIAHKERRSRSTRASELQAKEAVARLADRRAVPRRRLLYQIPVRAGSAEDYSSFLLMARDNFDPQVEGPQSSKVETPLSICGIVFSENQLITCFILGAHEDIKPMILSNKAQ